MVTTGTLFKNHNLYSPRTLRLTPHCGAFIGGRSSIRIRNPARELQQQRRRIVSSSPSPPSGIVHFVPNSHAFWSNPANWTTGLGPAYADITLASSNFVPCRGGPYALCYYSGPSGGAEDLSCTLSASGRYANCQ